MESEPIKKDLNKGKSVEEILALRAKKTADLKEEEKQILREHLTIKERLENKLATDIIKLKFEDNLGEFTVGFNKLSPQEVDIYRRMIDAQQKAKGNEDEENKINAQICEFIGKKSVDGLTKEFWLDQKGYSGDVLATVMMGLITGSMFPDERYLTGINSFRQK